MAEFNGARSPSYTPAPEAAFATTRPVREIATFGAVHLDITDRARSVAFWRDIVGLVVRNDAENVQLGTAEETLVTLHPVARAPFQSGHSGLYHLAIHPPTASEFGRILLRLIRSGWPISPTDHLMSKAIYLLDPDGITVEITLETPERMDKMLVDGPRNALLGVDGSLHGPAEPLDIPLALKALEDDDSSVPVPVGTKIGHVHLYVGDLDAAFDFYTSLGFNGALYMPAMQIADAGAGGQFNHRIAMNTWQGRNAPQAPEGTARMRNYTIRFDSEDRRFNAVANLDRIEAVEGGHLAVDPSGNSVFIQESA